MRLRPITAARGFALLLGLCPGLHAGAADAPPPNTPAPATAEPPSAAVPTPVVPLGPVTVQGKRTLFDEQAARRRKLLETSAPCLGCDARPLVHQPKLLERIADYALDQVTPQPQGERNEADRTDRQLDQQRALPTNAMP